MNALHVPGGDEQPQGPDPLSIVPALRAGEAAAAALREALDRVGLKAPGLKSGWPLGGQARVALGTVPAGTATQLAELLHQACDACPDLRADP